MQEYIAIYDRIKENTGCYPTLEIIGDITSVFTGQGHAYPSIPIDIRELRDLIKQLQSAEKKLQPKPSSTHFIQPQSLQHSCGHLSSEVKMLLSLSNSKEDTLSASSKSSEITSPRSQKSHLSR